MNNQRRKEIAAAQALAVRAFDAFTDAARLAGEAREAFEAIRDEEQEYFDNMPESLQGGDKGQMAEAAIEALDSAISALEDAEGFDVDIEGAIQSAGEAAA